MDYLVHGVTKSWTGLSTAQQWILASILGVVDAVVKMLCHSISLQRDPTDEKVSVEGEEDEPHRYGSDQGALDSQAGVPGGFSRVEGKHAGEKQPH